MRKLPEGPSGLPYSGSAVMGYTAGVYDMLHVGHINLLRQARAGCDRLTVGVSTDELAEEIHGQRPVISFLERMALVQRVRHCDAVLPQTTADKVAAWHVLKFDVLFVGDNLRGVGQWPQTERDLHHVGVRVVYLPATRTTTGKLLRRGLADVLEG